MVERGHALAIERPDIYALTHFRGELLHDLGAIPEARQAFERALEVGGDDIERCRAWIGLAAVMRISDQIQDALQALDRAQAVATAEDLIVELRGSTIFVAICTSHSAKSRAASSSTIWPCTTRGRPVPLSAKLKRWADWAMLPMLRAEC